jgi:hypothetical protein
LVLQNVVRSNGAKGGVSIKRRGSIRIFFSGFRTGYRCGENQRAGECVHECAARFAGSSGRNPIGNMDLLIASHAVSQGMTVVMNNLKQFSSVPGLLLPVPPAANPCEDNAGEMEGTHRAEDAPGQLDPNGGRSLVRFRP